MKDGFDGEENSQKCDTPQIPRQDAECYTTPKPQNPKSVMSK